MSVIRSKLIRSLKLTRRANRKSLNSVQGCTPALRARSPSSESNVVFEVAVKQASWNNPVGEYLEGTSGPHPFPAEAPVTTFGRAEVGANWKFVLSPVMIRNGRPDAMSIMGATVQLLKNFLAKPSPTSLPD